MVCKADVTAAARLLAVEILLAKPELLGNDALETDLYILRENLRTMEALEDTLVDHRGKNRFTEIADRAAAEPDHLTVTRNGRPHVMVVSVAEWDELQETLAVLSDPRTRADLAEAAEYGDFTTEDEMRAILEARLRRSGEG